MTLKDLLDLLHLHLRLLVAITLGVTLATGHVCLAMPNSYTASASMQVISESGSSSESQAMANDIATLLKSDDIKTAAAQDLGMGDASDYEVSVESTTTSRVIKVSVKGPSQDQVSSLCKQIASNVSKQAASSMGVKEMYSSSQPDPQAVLSGPKRAQYVAVGFLGGLFAAVVVIVCMDMARPRVHSGAEAVELLDGMPIIGRIPQIKG